MEGLVLNLASDACLFEGFSRRGFCVGSIVVNTTLGKRPPPATRAHQQELRFTFFQPIANCRNMNTFACEITVEILWPK